jgi:hypothetical protein
MSTGNPRCEIRQMLQVTASVAVRHADRARPVLEEQNAQSFGYTVRLG